ncbi:ABC transporter substrate-binding protein [Sneathiella marina]|uniref:ABC transporter substrate-binding protein n=1 Tax=Sneathiella marina TaxID=2950108 RepID=A0ABY4W5N9_9PROT|nr:ABC transporter substrate-binding protein [Sneathiella marina]USG62510.1 ABC transporter substrate-binding protein [Sneathiella marina]
MFKSNFMRPLSIIAPLAIAALLGAATAPLAEPQSGGTLNTTTTGYRTLNPGVQSGAATGVPGSQIFAGLVLIDEDYKATPYLAESWSVSDDNLSYSFKLVQGAKFHDGKPITSADVAFSLDTVKTNHPFGKAMFGNVASVETPDPSTVVFQLSAPIPGLLLSLEPLLMPILPKHVYGDGQEVKKHPRNMENVVGSGPFKVAENVPAERLVLVKNEEFFIKDRPYLDKLVFSVVKDSLTRVLMMEKGEIDYIGFSGIRPTDAERLEKTGNLTVTTEGYGAIGYIHYLELNLRDKPFNDRKVREALATAIDTNFIAKILFGGRTTVGTGPLHTGSVFYTSDVPSITADLDKAAKLLDEAGYPAGANGERFSFTLDIPSWAKQAHVPMAEYTQSQLGKIGVKVELRQAPDFGTWVKRISSFDYQATMNGSFNYPDPVIGVHRHFDCDNIRNVIWSNTQGYCDPAMDAMLDAAAVETDLDKRKATYAEIQRKAAEDLVFIYMPQDFTATVYSKKVGNPPASVFGPLAPWHEVYLKN